jgi:hypothetical protein
LHSLTPHGTCLTIIPLPQSIINDSHITYYNTGTSRRWRAGEWTSPRASS